MRDLDDQAKVGYAKQVGYAAMMALTTPLIFQDVRFKSNIRRNMTQNEGNGPYQIAVCSKCKYPCTYMKMRADTRTFLGQIPEDGNLVRFQQRIELQK